MCEISLKNCAIKYKFTLRHGPVKQGLIKPRLNIINKSSNLVE